MHEDWWRTGFKEAEQHPMHGDDFTFARTQSELRKIEAKMHEWYDVKVRGIFCSGKRNVHEFEILGRDLTGTEEGFEYEGSDKRRKAWG